MFFKIFFINKKSKCCGVHLYLALLSRYFVECVTVITAASLMGHVSLALDIQGETSDHSLQNKEVRSFWRTLANSGFQF